MGLLEIGYHLIIDRDGFIHRIRDILSIGSHCPAYNHRSVGVCLLGGLDEHDKHVSNFTPAQYRVLHNVIAAFKREWPFADVRGHNELPGYKTPRFQCPSLDMDAIRAWVTDARGQTLTEMVPNRSPKHNE